MARAFEIRREVELPATPEQVWQAVATGDGTAAWMFPVAEGAPSRVGEVWAGHTVKAYDPPRHLHVQMEGPDGQVMNALEYLIEAQDGGIVVLRYVHSGVFTDDWDNQYDSAGQHTDFYLHTLGQYLRYFAGQRATYIAAEGPGAAKAKDAFHPLRSELRLTPASKTGDQVRITPPGLDPVDGVLDYATPNFIGVRSADGLYRFFGRNAFGMPVGLSHHLFAAEVDQDKTQLAWQSWLDGLYQ
jgi:uncharacterized protein YndB with AHSA1/START domain